MGSVSIRSNEKNKMCHKKKKKNSSPSDSKVNHLTKTLFQLFFGLNRGRSKTNSSHWNTVTNFADFFCLDTSDVTVSSLVLSKQS